MDLHNQVAASIQEPQPGCSRQVPQAEPSFKRNLGIKIESPAIGQDSEDDPFSLDEENILIVGETSSQLVKAEGILSSKRPPERLAANYSKKVKTGPQKNSSKKVKTEP